MPIALDGIRTCISGIRAHSASDCTTTAGTSRVSRMKHFRLSPVSSIAKQSCMKDSNSYLRDRDAKHLQGRVCVCARAHARACVCVFEYLCMFTCLGVCMCGREGVHFCVFVERACLFRTKLSDFFSPTSEAPTTAEFFRLGAFAGTSLIRSRDWLCHFTESLRSR